MYRLRKPATNQSSAVQGAVVALSSIRQSCMLIPAFSQDGAPSAWKFDNVLDQSDVFYLNNWLSKYSYQTLY